MILTVNTHYVLNRANRLVFMLDADRVLCEIRSEYLMQLVEREYSNSCYLEVERLLTSNKQNARNRNTNRP